MNCIIIQLTGRIVQFLLHNTQVSGTQRIHYSCLIIFQNSTEPRHILLCISFPPPFQDCNFCSQRIFKDFGSFATDGHSQKCIYSTSSDDELLRYTTLYIVYKIVTLFYVQNASGCLQVYTYIAELELQVHTDLHVELISYEQKSVTRQVTSPYCCYLGTCLSLLFLESRPHCVI